MPTAKQQLIEHLYDGDLAAEIASWLEDGSTWRDIAGRVSKATDQQVSHESLRGWYGHLRPEPDTALKAVGGAA